MEIKPQIETFAKIKVVGVGGAGGITVNHMIDCGIRGVEFIAINTDAQALQYSKAPVKIHIGKNLTRGLGAGMDPDKGRKSAEENKNEIADALKDSDMVFLTCGCGGGTGSGALPVVANIAKELGALTIAVITKPFSFEGAMRKRIADDAFNHIIDKVDTVITIHNDRILQIVEKKTPLHEAYSLVEDILRQGIQGISELVTVHGRTNVDFADVKFIMQGAGSALMGIGVGKGENRAVEAAKAAIESPLLETSIDGATGVLFTVTAGDDFSMFELSEIARIITEFASPDARIIYGTITDESLKDEVKVTVVATGFGRQAISAKKHSIAMHGTVPATNSYRDVYQEKNDEQDVKEKIVVSQETAESAQSAIRNSFSSKKIQADIKPNDVDRVTTDINDQVYSQSQSTSNNDSDVNDDELEIPAFIRKRM